MSEPDDRKYRMTVTFRSGGWYGFVGGMAKAELSPVAKAGTPILFPTEAKALRGCFHVLQQMIHRDIEAFRAPDGTLALKRANPVEELNRLFGSKDGERIYHKPGRSVPVTRKKRRRMSHANG